MKIMKTLLAGFSAAALLFAASCTNQLDYLNATTNRTAVKIGGFKVTGLDKSLNGAKAQLMDKDGELISAIVADHYEKDDVVVGYAAGTAYAKLETPIQMKHVHLKLKFTSKLVTKNTKLQKQTEQV